MPRKRKSLIPPPFPLHASVLSAYADLQREHGNCKGFSELERWKLAQCAELQARYRRCKLDPALLVNLKRARSEFGLPELPA